VARRLKQSLAHRHGKAVTSSSATAIPHLKENQTDGIQPASAIKHCILGESAVSGKGQ
jgi:hypothetical protein